MSETAKTYRVEEGDPPFDRVIVDDQDYALCNVYGVKSKERATLIVTAVNALEPMKKALDDLLNQVIHWGDDSQLEAIAAEIKAAEAALRLAEGEKE